MLLPHMMVKFRKVSGKKKVRILAYHSAKHLSRYSRGVKGSGSASTLQPSAGDLGLYTLVVLPELSDKPDLPFYSWKCLALFFARIKSSAWVSLISG